MKKYLSLIGALALGTTATLSVVACGTEPGDGGTEPTEPATENIKAWGEETSVIAKALILSKNENFNTNNLLTKALSENNNIQQDTNSNTGSSYENFKNIWGYKGNIEGFETTDFNSNTDSTVDNNQLASKESITSTMKQIQSILSELLTYKPLIPGLSPIILKEFYLNPKKAELIPTLYGLKANPEIITMIENFLPVLSKVINNFGNFNAQEVLGNAYNEDITKVSLFGDDGWIAKYQSVPGFTSEAFRNKSSILNTNYFKNYDQLALFKNSIDLNAFIYKLSGDKKESLGDMINKALTYDGDTITEFDLTKLFTEFTSIWSSSPENIIELISNLIPIVKYSVFGILPTQAITKITTLEETNPETGVINIADIITKVKEILLTKEGFTSFISNILFAPSETEFNLANYITFDITSNKKPLSQAFLPLKDDLTTLLDMTYDTTIKPIITNASVTNIIDIVETNLATLTTSSTGFEFQLSQFQGIVNILNNPGLSKFFNKILGYSNEKELTTDWDNLWATLGINNSENFDATSVLGQIQKFLMANSKFLDNVSHLLNAALPIIEQSFDAIISNTNSKITSELTNFSIDDNSVKYNWNATSKETTIRYNLLNQTNNKTYIVTVVVKGDADTVLGTDAKQVWLKSLIEAK